ncbi:hypothetical protein CRG98_013475 [Punica granatum]|uniref:Uncharacterized protein n=1 Tax=Punica granatum TaxID=22663 RepID=A0A2I0KC64_PUNGR|nr:hypothetical protein CRG98_013475 [Punica granatum]
MTLRCPDFYGVPLVSHAGSTTYFLVRVVKQLNGLQMVPEDTARTKFEHTWREDQTSVDRQSSIEQVLAAWQTVITKRHTSPSIRPMRNEISKLRRNTSFASIDGVQKHMRILPTLHKSKLTEHSGHLPPQIWPSKPSLLASEPREIVFAWKSQKRTSSLLISVNYRGSSPKPASSYRGAIRNWRERTPLWRGPGKRSVEVYTHPRIDNSARPLPGIGASHGDGRLHLGCGGRPI